MNAERQTVIADVDVLVARGWQPVHGVQLSRWHISGRWGKNEVLFFGKGTKIQDVWHEQLDPSAAWARLIL
jgi:hypothetical protein